LNNTKIKTARAAFNKLLLNESRLAWRIPVGLGMGLGLPLLLLVIFVIIPGTRQSSSDFSSPPFHLHCCSPPKS
jgi:hypothetical protein